MQTKSNRVFHSVRKHHIAMSLGIVLLLAAGILGSTVWKKPIVSTLTNWKILSAPEQLTELYFSRPNNLPSTYAPSAPQAVAFVVHNTQKHAATYTYDITLSGTSPTVRQAMAHGRFTLQSGEVKTFSNYILLGNAGPRAKVTVSLSSGQSISYWVTRQ